MEWNSNLRAAAAVAATALLSLGIHGCQPSPDSDDSSSGALAGQPGLAGALSLCTTNAQCDDLNPCTADTCVERVCRHENVTNGLPCDDDNACTTEDKCSNGVCEGGATVTCNDDNPCTTDFCAPATGCVYADVQTGAACDDGDACTTNDTCKNGVCGGGSAASCDDGNPCTADSCDAATGCVYTNVEDGTACDDGDACTTDTTCTGGICGDATP